MKYWQSIGCLRNDPLVWSVTFNWAQTNNKSHFNDGTNLLPGKTTCVSNTISSENNPGSETLHLIRCLYPCKLYYNIRNTHIFTEGPIFCLFCCSFVVSELLVGQFELSQCQCHGNRCISPTSVSINIIHNTKTVSNIVQQADGEATGVMWPKRRLSLSWNTHSFRPKLNITNRSI